MYYPIKIFKVVTQFYTAADVHGILVIIDDITQKELLKSVDSSICVLLSG